MIDMRAQCWNLEGPLRPIKSLTKFMKNFQSWKFHVKSNEFEEKLFRVKSNAQQIFSMEHIFLKEQEKSNFLEGTNLLEETNLLTLFHDRLVVHSSQSLLEINTLLLLE